MKKKEQGILTVEASLVLMIMTLFVLFLFSFARVYSAQSLVSHATLQTADAVALESYLRETALQSDVDDIVHISSIFNKTNSLSAEGLESLRSANLPKIAKEKFSAAVGSSTENADAKLRYLGVKNGLDGIDFSYSSMDLGRDDVIIAVTYTIEMQFPVFGAKEIEVTKSAKAKTFGDILFEVSTDVNVPGWGSTTGDTKVVHGTTVVITATPNYGYVFDKWSDGNTEPVREVTVNDAQHYTAIFKKDKFGINLSVNNGSWGSVSGAGTYEYLDTATIKATPKQHYYFAGWDDNGDGAVDNTSAVRNITVDKTYSFKAIFKPVQYTIKVNVNNGTFGSALVKQGSKSGTSIKADYGSQVDLVAASKNGTLYRFTGWSNNCSQLSQKVTVKGDTTYTANFDYNTCIVKFIVDNNSNPYHTSKVIIGHSIDSSVAAGVPDASRPTNPWKSGADFKGWYYEKTNKKFEYNENVSADKEVKAKFTCVVTFELNDGSGRKQTDSVDQGNRFNFDAYKPSRNGYTFTGWYLNNNRICNTNVNSHITVTAGWSCNHKDDNGNTKYVPVNKSGGCVDSLIEYRCQACNDKTYEKGTGAHSYHATCGVIHDYVQDNLVTSASNAKYYCTHESTKHLWKGYSCITCLYCGGLKNETAYKLVTRSGPQSKWCVLHNGHSKYYEVDGNLPRPVKGPGGRHDER